MTQVGGEDEKETPETEMGERARWGKGGRRRGRLLIWAVFFRIEL